MITVVFFSYSKLRKIYLRGLKAIWVLFLWENEMPKKPKKPCAYPGCPKLTYGRYCVEHEKLNRQHYEKYKRNPATKKRYGPHWKRIRDAYVKEHPVCEMCKKRGINTQTQEVHHIIPLAEGGSSDWDNLMALCKSCHSRLHTFKSKKTR